jgi:hypothetical protein
MSMTDRTLPNIIHRLREYAGYNQKNHPKAAAEFLAMADGIEQGIYIMAREAKVITALKAETATANAAAIAAAAQFNTAQTALEATNKTLADLQAAGHVKDDADVVAEQAEATRLNLDVNGDPLPVVPVATPAA